jgi:hypothetical protein
MLKLYFNYFNRLVNKKKTTPVRIHEGVVFKITAKNKLC